MDLYVLIKRVNCLINNFIKFTLLLSSFVYGTDNITGQNYKKNTNHQQMHKESFIINRNTLLHFSTLLGHLQGELFCYRYTKVALYS
jgi:hypothetical protein